MSLETTGSGYFGGCGVSYGRVYGISYGFTAGGTGSIYPSEFGVHSTSHNSGALGYTLDINFRDFQIPLVGLNDTFETWRVRTNNSIIGKLNKLRIYGATAGDGMMIANSTGGTLAIAFSGNVLRQNTTFCNDLHVGGNFTVENTSLGSKSATAGFFQDGYNFSEKILVLNHFDNAPGCSYSGLILGGGVTGPDPASVSSAGDLQAAFVFDRPYLLHKDAYWRTKEGMWFEGFVDHNDVFSGPIAGSTSDTYPNGPYGTSLCKEDVPQYGVSRFYFGPTLSSHNFLDIDGRGGIAGSTGYVWHDPSDPTNATIGGATGAIVLSNSAGELLEFDANSSGSAYATTNIYRGANRHRVEKSSHGFKVGNVIRYDGTAGYTFASAEGEGATDGIAAAEVLGVVSKVVDANTFDVAFMGEVTKTNWSDVTDSGSSSLDAGCVYFLSPLSGASRGKITKTKPNIIGQIHKPVMLAIGSTSGIVMPYAGVVLGESGCTANTNTTNNLLGATANNSNSFFRSYNTVDQSFAVGDVVEFSTSTSSGIKKSDSRYSPNPVGIVVSDDETSGTLEIVTSGQRSLDYDIVESFGTFYLGENGRLVSTPPQNAVKILDALSPSLINVNIQSTVLNNPQSANFGATRRRGSVVGSVGQSLLVQSPTGATGFTYDDAGIVKDNELLNGDFGIWQRGIGLTGGVTGFTAHNHTFFADRWIRVSQTGTGGVSGANNPISGASCGTHRTLNYRLQRKSFAKDQIKVEGHPDYYARVKGDITFVGGTNNNEWHKFEQRIEDVTSFAGEVMTASFYVKGSTTGSCSLCWIQNRDGNTGAPPGYPHGTANNPKGNTANEIWTPITDFNVTTDWAKHAYAFVVPEVTGISGASGSSVGITGSHFASLSFFTQLTSLPNDTAKNIYYNGDLDIAKVKLERGSIATLNKPVNKVEELQKVQRFYQTSYEDTKYMTSETMRSVRRPDTSGVWFTVPGTYIHVHSLPVRMRVSPTTRVFSPTGVENEAFNVDAGNDLRYTAGTKGSIDNEVRQTLSGSSNLSVFSDSKKGIEITVVRGAAKLDTVVVHYAADSEFNNALPPKPVSIT